VRVYMRDAGFLGRADAPGHRRAGAGRRMVSRKRAPLRDSGARQGRAQIAGTGRRNDVGDGGVCQKTVAQSFFMLTIVQPSLAARSSACSAPLV
jgi:hypothetical protein